MTADSSMALPPRWAETLLRLLLRPEDRESVSGDLLEEYRESIVPAAGARANRWYVRQVAGYVLRETRIWFTLVAVFFIGRQLVDMFVPVHYTPGLITLRSSIMSWGVIVTFTLCAAWHAWRTRRIGSAMLLVVLAAIAAAILTTTGALVSLVIVRDPQALRAIATRDGIGEVLFGPLAGALLVGLVTGLPGAIAGRLAGAIHAKSIV